MPIPLRSDFDALQLRTIARKTKSGPLARGLLALAAVYDEATRTEAAKIGGLTLHIVRDWVMKFNAHGTRGPHRQEGARPAFEAQRYPSGGARQDDRGGSNPGDSRRRALAAHLSLPMGFRGVPCHSLGTDDEPRTAHDGAFASSRRVHAIMRRPMARSKILKKSPRPSGSHRARKASIPAT